MAFILCTLINKHAISIPYEYTKKNDENEIKVLQIFRAY